MSRTGCWFALLLLLLGSPVSRGQLRPCGFCALRQDTLRQKLAEAKLVVFGTLANPSMNPAGDEKTAVTDLRVERVLKADPAIEGRRVITLNRYLSFPDPKKPPRYLVFFDVEKGKLDPYWGSPASEDLVKYLQGALKLDPKKPGEVLAYFHRQLASPSKEIAEDAFRELQALSDAVIRLHAGRLSADVIAERLRSEKTPSWGRGLEASLLGHCGTERHATFLRGRIEKGLRSEGEVGMYGLLIGYTLLKPSEGLAQLRRIAADRKLPFTRRYECLKALRYFRDVRKEVWKRADLIRTMALMLEQEDIADLIIEELRRDRVEQMTTRSWPCAARRSSTFPSSAGRCCASV